MALARLIDSILYLIEDLLELVVLILRLLLGLFLRVIRFLSDHSLLLLTRQCFFASLYKSQVHGGLFLGGFLGGSNIGHDWFPESSMLWCRVSLIKQKLFRFERVVRVGNTERALAATRCLGGSLERLVRLSLFSVGRYTQ